MHLTSPAFHDGGQIHAVYTCNGKNYNPPLQIIDAPQGAVSLALIMDDPDVPEFVRKDRMWVHWVVYDIPPKTTVFRENATPPGTLGKGTGGQMKYQGPCPPDRQHRYFFKLYALDIPLGLEAGATKTEVEKAMEGHILEQAQLMGIYRQP